MQKQIQLPSRIQRVNHPVYAKNEVEVWLKRDDEIHPAISGNKWRKLKYNLLEIQQRGLKGFITFGGAFSNHLAASAYAGNLAGIKMIGIVRGEEAVKNATLDFVQQCGMDIHRISRAEYSQKNEPEFLEKLSQKYPDLLIIPEGGSNLLGVKGCAEILEEVFDHFDVISCPLGSATTFAGLVLSGKTHQQFLGFPAVKGGGYLESIVNNFVTETQSMQGVNNTFTAPAWHLQTAYHFGGFGKVTPELIHFMNDFWEKTSIPLDPVYTGKMMSGLTQMIEQSKFEKGTRLLALHTGGLQGIKGMNERLRNKDFHIEYEETVATAFPNPLN